MDKLYDYVKWMGPYTFRQVPFREADALVLSLLAYFDLAPLFREDQKEARLKDCLPLMEGEGLRLCMTGGDLGSAQVLEAAVRSVRFGELTVTDHRDLSRAEPPLQFSAVTFHAPGVFSFLAYRGTDNTLTGWREDFMTSFTQTEAQRLAAQYAREIIWPDGRDWYIGGHSKGGNHALCAACDLPEPLWRAVTRVWLLDGPGLCPEVMDVGQVERIAPKTTRILPQYAVVGKLFEPNIPAKVVKSHQLGLLQHALASWGIDYGELAYTQEVNPRAAWFSQTLEDWFGSIPQEERPAFVDELFDALGAGGVDDLSELTLEDVRAALFSLNEKSKTTRHILSELPRVAWKRTLHPED